MSVGLPACGTTCATSADFPIPATPMTTATAFESEASHSVRMRTCSVRPKNGWLGTAARGCGAGRGSSTTSAARTRWTASASRSPARRSASIASAPGTTRRPSGPDSSKVRVRAWSRIRRETSCPAGVSSYTLRRERAFVTWAIRSPTFPVDFRRFNSSATWARLSARAAAIPSWVISTGHS